MHFPEVTGPQARGRVEVVAGYLLVLCAVALAVVPHHLVERFAVPVACIVIVARWGRGPMGRIDWLFIGAVLLPFAVFLCATFVHDSTERRTGDHAAHPDFWLQSGIVGAIFVLGALRITRWDRVAPVALPVFILLLFAFLTVERFDPDNASMCRIVGAKGLPFTPALVISCFALLYVALSPRLGRHTVPLSALCLMAAVVVVMGYTASRGVLLALLGGCLMTCLALVLYRQGKWLQRLTLILAALIGGGVSSVAIDVSFGCEGIVRLQSMMDAARAPSTEPDQTARDEEATAPPGTPSPAPADGAAPAPTPTSPEPKAAPNVPDRAIALRFVFWDLAFDRIAEAPLLGTGRLAEMELLDEYPHNHVHQQYLSWLIWFGLPGLVAGAVGLAAPMLALRRLPPGQDRATAAAVFCSALPITMFFDSLLRLDQFIAFQALFAALAYAMIRDAWTDRDLAAGPTATGNGVGTGVGS